jgi:hypothetical protein
MLVKLPWSFSGASPWMFDECSIVFVVNIIDGNIMPHHNGDRCFELTNGWDVEMQAAWIGFDCWRLGVLAQKGPFCFPPRQGGRYNNFCCVVLLLFVLLWVLTRKCPQWDS